MKNFIDKVIITKSEKETKKVATEFAKSLRAGAVVLLDGDLGAGKTVFAKGFALGIGIKSDIVSPTFAIVNNYDGKLYHFDLYRLTSEAELIGIGADEIIFSGVSCLIEWPFRINKNYYPKNSIVVTIKKVDEKIREIAIRRLD